MSMIKPARCFFALLTMSAAILVSAEESCSSAIPVLDASDYPYQLREPGMKPVSSSASLELGDDKKTATLNLGLKFGEVKIKAPLDKATKEPSSINLDGLNGAATIGYGYTMYLFGDSPVPTIKPKVVSTRQKELCALVGIDSDSSCVCREGNFSSALVVKLEVLGKDKEKEKIALACELAGLQLSDDCMSSQTHLDAVRKAEELFKLNQNSPTADKVDVPKPYAWVMPMKVEYGVQDFSYYDSADLSKKVKDSDDVYSASIAIGRLVGNSYYAGIGYEYQQGYKSQDTVELCTPVESSPTSSTCREAVIGKPKSLKRDKGFIDYRYNFGNGSAMGVKLTHDFENDEQAIQIPFYFVVDERTGLSAGFEVSRDTEKDEWIGQLFFGKDFSFID